MKRLIIFSVIIILLIVFLVFLYFYSVWSDEQNIEKEMINEAFKKVPALHTIEDVDFFSGDKQYYFILGKSPIGNNILIWINKEEINSVYLYDWVTKEQITKKILESNQKIIIKRITMGLNSEGNLIYETLFEDEEGRLGYQYYSLETGELLKTYKLGKIN